MDQDPERQPNDGVGQSVRRVRNLPIGATVYANANRYFPRTCPQKRRQTHKQNHWAIALLCVDAPTQNLYDSILTACVRWMCARELFCETPLQTRPD